MKQISTKQLNTVCKQYILDCINSEPYDVVCNNNSEKIAFLYNTFNDEAGWNIPRVGQYKAFTEWIQGLPTVFSIKFTNYDIIQLAIEWGSLPKNPTDRQCNKILENYFNLITVKFFQLVRKYKI